jgi:hypothetical protein
MFNLLNLNNPCFRLSYRLNCHHLFSFFYRLFQKNIHFINNFILNTNFADPNSLKNFSERLKVH